MRKFLCTSVAAVAAFAASMPGGADAMSSAYATFEGPINSTSTGGATTTCVQVQSTATPSGTNDCKVTWGMNAGKSLCDATPEQHTGWANYVDYRTGSTYTGIALAGVKGAASGVLAGQYLAAGGRIMQITINASDACPAADLADGLGLRLAADATRDTDRFTGRVNALVAV